MNVVLCEPSHVMVPDGEVELIITGPDPLCVAPGAMVVANETPTREMANSAVAIIAICFNISEVTPRLYNFFLVQSHESLVSYYSENEERN